MDVLIERGVPLPEGSMLLLPDDMRDELRVPLGPVLQEDDLVSGLGGHGPVCTVGDMTTETVDRLGFPIRLAIVDYQTQRRPDTRWVETLSVVGDTVLEVDNPAASITPSMYNGIIGAWASEASVKMVVTGEEDMASLPAILHAPGGATVIYGIPDTGLCLVQVDEHARDVVTDVLERLIVHREGSPPRGGRQDGT